MKCVLDGVVEAVATSEEEGCTVTLNHGGNWITVYSHLEAVQVEKVKLYPKAMSSATWAGRGSVSLSKVATCTLRSCMVMKESIPWNF